MNIVVMQTPIAALAEIERACFHAPCAENMLREELGKYFFRGGTGRQNGGLRRLPDRARRGVY